jgi:hypothetical protein
VKPTWEKHELNKNVASKTASSNRFGHAHGDTNVNRCRSNGGKLRAGRRTGTKIGTGRLECLTTGRKNLAARALSKLDRTTAPENQIRQQNRTKNRWRRVPHPIELGTAPYRIHKQEKQVARPGNEEHLRSATKGTTQIKCENLIFLLKFNKITTNL